MSMSTKASMVAMFWVNEYKGQYGRRFCTQKRSMRTKASIVAR
jgi:hypothetical protein